MDCPRCKIPLNTQTLNEVNITVEVDKCNSCGGTWFDKGELDKLEKIIEPTFIEVRKLPSKKEQLQTLNCPSCNNLQLLEKAEHSRDKKVIIDFCPSCKGLWLDKGELEAIQKENGFITLGRIFKWIFS